jgi:UDP-N-acetyl-D-glucosamine dehydrogenase
MERTLNAAGKPMRGSRVLILGVSYKAGVGDLREAPALKIIELARGLGAEIAYHDPYVPELSELGLRSVPLEEELAGADLVTIVTAHPGVDYERVAAEASLVLDFRGVTRGISAPNLVRL